MPSTHRARPHRRQYICENLEAFADYREQLFMCNAPSAGRRRCDDSGIRRRTLWRAIADGLAGIAVPLLDGGRVHGVINVTWPKSVRIVEDTVRDCLGDLQAAATEIVDTLRSVPEI